MSAYMKGALHISTQFTVLTRKFKAVGYQNGRVYLTTHRLCYVDEALPQTNSVSLHLSSIKKAEYHGGFLRSSPKIILYLKAEDDSASGTATPASSAVNLRTITWICPICYFSNELPQNYEHGVSPVPVCLTCGIKASEELIEKTIEQADASSFESPAESSSANDSGPTDSDGFKCPRCTFNNHPSLTHCELCGARLVSAKLPPALARPDSPGPTTLINSSIVENNIVKLSFRGNIDKSFYLQVKTALNKQSWRTITTSSLPAATLERAEALTPVGAGLHGLQQFGEINRQKNQLVLGSALEDLNSLMAKAKEVVALAEEYAKHLEREEARSGSSLSLASRKALRESSQALGLQSTIVTKDMAQNEAIFYEETARQIAEFLESQNILAKQGAVSLVDLFAMYNRARGIALISPRDLMAACEMFDKLQLPIRLRKYRSGLIVVQEAYRTPQVVIKSILSWLKGLESWKAEIGVSVQDASVKFGWSVTVAGEELGMAEEYGALCRDEQLSGIRYFENKIVEYVV